MAAAGKRDEWMIVGGSIATAVAAFMPWYSIAFISVNGIDGDGQISLIGAVVSGVIGVMALTSDASPARWRKILALVAAAIAALVGLYHLLKDSEGASVQLGVYLTVAGGLVASIGCIQLLRQGSAVPVGDGPAAVPTEGWYPDPGDASRYRYSDGQQWTEHTAPRHAPPPADGQTPAT